LIATASRVGTAFYTFGLVLLPTLAFVGLVTCERVLQCGVEDRIVGRAPAATPNRGGRRGLDHRDGLPSLVWERAASGPLSVGDRDRSTA
jgi:hypothetical protein